VSFPASVEVVDSHTEGEPTRVVLGGWPQPAGATMAERRSFLLREQDALRAGVVCEPRGHDAMVGALLTPPVAAGSVCGVVFFNNAGGLWMCGHGLIGVVTTLAHLDRIGPGRVSIDTPVGTVAATLDREGAVTFENVPAMCSALDVEVQVPGHGAMRGDVAWGGNWFFLCEAPGIELELRAVRRLTELTRAIRDAVASSVVTGANGEPIDHIELFGPPTRPDADSRNFVLCPGDAYDRSPCGTGTSAKLAALWRRGKLRPGQRWRQESITGSVFTGWIEERAGQAIPHIRGRAWIVGRSTLLFADGDPFRHGFTAAIP
jgi:4-hydroxyproline epimerase